MKRRQEGTKILVIGIAGMLLAIGAGCGAGRGEPFSGKDPGMEIREVPGGEQDALLDWQSQYDLGIRLLGEGKYQEAIIAFTAAIEIELSRAALYAARGDAYMAMGAEGMGTTSTDGFGMAEEPARTDLRLTGQERMGQGILNCHAAMRHRIMPRQPSCCGSGTRGRVVGQPLPQMAQGIWNRQRVCCRKE